MSGKEKSEFFVEESPNVATKGSSSKKSGWMILSIVLILLLLVAVAAIIALAVVLGLEIGKDDPEPVIAQPDVCTDLGCVDASTQLLSGLDMSVDPCQDFYQFACGNWLRNNIIPPGEGSYGTFDGVIDQNHIFLRKSLEGDNEDSDVEAVRKATDFYQSCLDTGTINALGASPFLDLVARTGGWSLIGIPDDEPWSINSTLFIREHLYGSDAFFSISISPDLMNSSVNRLGISQGGVALPKEFFASDIARNALKQYYVTILTLVNATVESSVYEDAMEEMVEFESRLANIQISGPELFDFNVNFQTFTLGELSTLWPDGLIQIEGRDVVICPHVPLQRLPHIDHGVYSDFDWQSYFQGVGDVGNLTFDENEPVVVEAPAYFTRLTTLFRESNISALQNYAKMRLLSNYISYLSDDFTDALGEFSLLLTGTGKEPDRTKTCTSQVQSSFAFAVARPFVRNFVPEGTRENTSMLIDYINKAFKARLEELDWLDDTTRQRSKEKVDALVRFIAYPEQLFDDDYINGFYVDHVVNSSRFFENVFLANFLSIRNQLRNFRIPVNKNEWPNNLDPATVNAFYSPQLNGYVFLAGILYPPFFRANWPDYLNFGAIGVVIGHELTHGFDNIGQQFDKDGIRRQWWTDASNTEFLSRHKCFVDQYSQYENQGFPVNGNLTLGENIADNGGVNAAFRAHRMRIENEGEPLKLPGLDYTPDQLFFIGYAQLWCTLYTPQWAQFLSFSAVHSPGPARVRGPLVNSVDFAEVFKCPAGSPMNPEGDKCILW